jgi:aminopeptidase N
LKKYNSSAHGNKESSDVSYDPAFATQNIPLFLTEAETRLKMVSQVSYELILVLTKEESSYDGKVVIEFRLTDKDLSELTLDFHGKSFNNMYVNDSKVDLSCVKFNKHKIYLPQYYLKSNSLNKVEFNFEGAYVNNSQGFHKFQDQVDNEVYLYTHLEPFSCHKWFPCFD